MGKPFVCGNISGYNLISPSVVDSTGRSVINSVVSLINFGSSDEDNVLSFTLFTFSLLFSGILEGFIDNGYKQVEKLYNDGIVEVDLLVFDGRISR